MAIVLMYAIVCIPLGWMWFQEKRTIAALPVVTVDDGNFAGAGVLVDLPSGGEALLLAESLSVPDFVGAMHDVKNGELKATGKVIDTITDTQVEYYGFDESDFPDPPTDGRVMLLLSYP